MLLAKVEDLSELRGKLIGISDWKVITQERINLFADCTDDHQFIHIDEERALKESPFGGAIAHGFLSLSLLSKFAHDVAVNIECAEITVNYGFNKIRFIQPVRVGNKIRAKFELAEVSERNPGQWLLTYKVTIEIEKEDKPALVAEWITMQIVN